MDGIAGSLPADVLLEIFSYCSFKDLLRIQSVCKWWREVARKKCLWKDIVYKPDCIDSAKDIIDILKASPELRALDLSDVACNTVTKDLVEELVKGCPKLEQLIVLWDCLYVNIHKEMKKIKILILDTDRPFVLKVDFEYLQKYFPNVEQLHTRSLKIIKRDLQEYLTNKRQFLHTVGFPCRMVYCNCILRYLSVCTKLKNLTLYGLCYQLGHIPVKAAGHLKQISSLTLRDSGRSVLKNYLSILSHFPNLVALHLENIILRNEQVLLLVAKNCPLIEKLILCSLKYIRDDSLQYVSNFKKLTFLCLKSNRDITDACVTHLETILELRYLDISGCERLTPQCLLTLCSFDKLQTLKFDLQNRDPPTDFGATPVKNRHLHIMFYNCKDTSVLEDLRRQRLSISLLKDPLYKIEC